MPPTEHSAYIHVEQTLAIIKPDAISKASEIEEKILKEGFSILQVYILVIYCLIGVFLF